MSVRETAERIRALSDSERVGTITTDYVYLGEGEGEMPMDCIDWTIPTDDLKELAQAWLDANPKDKWHHLGQDMYMNQSEWECKLGQPIEFDCDPKVCTCKDRQKCLSASGYGKPCQYGTRGCTATHGTS